MKKKYIYIAIGLLVILVAAAITKSKLAPQGIKVSVEEVKTGKVIELVSANGKVQPEVEVTMSPDVPGEIIELPVKEGQKVAKGDLLAVINPDILQSTRERMAAALNQANANLANSRARLAQAEARLINAKANYNRNKKLVEDKAISQADFDAVTAEYEVAKADVEAAKETVKGAEFNVKSARAALKEADDNLKRTRIYAPMDGTVSKLSVELGERVVGTSQMAGTEIMRIADLTNMEVNVDVNESDIIRISLGDTAEIEVDAYLDRTFYGVVTEIANSAKSDMTVNTDQVTSFSVKIRILRSSYQDLIDHSHPHLSPFRPGMSAAVDIKTDRKKGITIVPIQAVTLRPDTAKPEKEEELVEVVFVQEGEKAIMKKVTTGIQDSKNIEIKKGVSVGEQVIVSPYSAVSKFLENEKAIEVVEEDMLFESKEE